MVDLCFFSFFFFQQKTAYEMRISDWSSDVCSSDLLSLAAETSGVTVLLLRVSALPAPSTAHTRWAVRSAPSLPLEANAPGHPAMEVELLRQRGRPAGGVWQVEWDREQTIFRDRKRDRPALSGRSEERSVGKECVNQCRTWWAPSH